VREEETLAIIYLDNAATSWPKAPGVSAAMVRFLEEVGANPGRSGHRLSIEAGRIVDDAREALAQLFRAPDPLRVIFTANATEALNLALQGLLRPGDHVVTSSVEHNSVMRPLRALESTGVALTVVPCAPDGTLDPARLEAAIGPTTRLIGITHASNVVGTLLPVAEAGRIARRRDLLLLVDAAADAGAFPIDVVEEQIDLLAFTGHKSLYGPMGTGGLVIGDRVDPARLRPLKWGGTGSRSDREEQPAFLPDCYESGTLNAVGLAGLAASVRWLLERGVEAIRERQVELVQHLIDGLSSIEGVTVHGTCDARRQVAPVSFTLRGISPSDAALRLDEEHGVLCRVGLHCAPAAHRTIGTFPAGTIRFAAGTFNTEAEIDAAIAAVAALVPPAGGEVTS
jgi:cysteine desulfurase family protein